jgi:hypothetical protein
MIPKFQIDETVKVKVGIIEEDFEVDLSGRVGRISGWEADDLEEPLYYVDWDSMTLNEIGMESIRFYEENDTDWDSMCLYESEIEANEPRDMPKDVVSAITMIQEKLDNRT